MTEPTTPIDEDPVEDTDVRIELGGIDAQFRPRVHVGFDGVESGPMPFTENVATFALEPWHAVRGIPQPGTPPPAGSASVSALTVATEPLDPYLLFRGDAFAHWVPHPFFFGRASGADQAMQFWPIGWTRNETAPRMTLWTNRNPVPPEGIGRSPWGPHGPQYVGSHRYPANNGRLMTRNALVFETKKNGDSGFAQMDPKAVFPSATMALTVVMHPHTRTFGGLYEARDDIAPPPGGLATSPLLLRWDHGVLRLVHERNVVLSHETHRTTGTPMVIMLSLDSVSDVGRFYVLDANRTTRTFNTEGMQFVSLKGVLGILGQGNVRQPYRWPAQMDLLDYAIWNRALSWAEMEARVNLLALAYGAA